MGRKALVRPEGTISCHPEPEREGSYMELGGCAMGVGQQRPGDNFVCVMLFLKCSSSSVVRGECFRDAANVPKKVKKIIY